MRFESVNTENSFYLLNVKSVNKNWLSGFNKTGKYQIEISSEVKKGT
jgi:hypothetical protein